MRKFGVDMAPELRIFDDGATFEFVSPIDIAWQLGIKPPCPSCGQSIRLQPGHGGVLETRTWTKFVETRCGAAPYSHFSSAILFDCYFFIQEGFGGGEKSACGSTGGLKKA